MPKRKRQKTKPVPRESGKPQAAAPNESESSPLPWWTTFRAQLGIVVCIALLLRLMNVSQTGVVPTITNLLGDAAGYFRWAFDIVGTDAVAGDWYGKTTFYQAPAYPYFLAVLMKLLGAGVSEIRVVQALLGATGVLLIGLTARNLFCERVGVVSAAMLAFYPAAIYYDGIIQKTSLAAFLLCVLLAACSYFAKNERRSVAYLIGLSLGLLVLTRENALLWLPIVPVWILFALNQRSWGARWALVGCYVLGAATTLLPVAARNASLGGEWSPTTFQAGPNFYIGNNLQADGIYRPLVPGHETPIYERADAQRLAESAIGKELTAREVSQFWMSRSFDEIKQDPGRWIQLVIQKSLMVVNHFEVPDVESMHFFREYSLALKSDRLWHFGILCPLAVLGLVITVGQWRELWLYHLLTISMVGAIVLFFILGRYRFPLVPLLVPFAAHAVHQLWTCIRQRQLNIAKTAIAAAVIAAIVCNLPLHDQRGLNASSVMNVAIAAGKSGDLPRCIRLLRDAESEAPDFPEIHFNLGRAYSKAGEPRKAIASLQTALQLDPTLISAEYFLAQELERIGERKSALFLYQRAVKADPTNTNAAQAIERLMGNGAK